MQYIFAETYGIKNTGELKPWDSQSGLYKFTKELQQSLSKYADQKMLAFETAAGAICIPPLAEGQTCGSLTENQNYTYVCSLELSQVLRHIQKDYETKTLMEGQQFLTKKQYDEVVQALGTEYPELINLCQPIKDEQARDFQNFTHFSVCSLDQSGAFETKLEDTVHFSKYMTYFINYFTHFRTYFVQEVIEHYQPVLLTLPASLVIAYLYVAIVLSSAHALVLLSSAVFPLLLIAAGVALIFVATSQHESS